MKRQLWGVFLPGTKGNRTDKSLRWGLTYSIVVVRKTLQLHPNAYVYVIADPGSEYHSFDGSTFRQLARKVGMNEIFPSGKIPKKRR